MNIEQIHDALNLLDDDMIEEVEQLRDFENQSVKIFKRNRLIRLVAMAAGVCLVIGCYYVTDGFGLMSHKGTSNDSLKGESSNWIPSHGDGDSTGNVPESDTEDGTDVTDNMSGEQYTQLQKVTVEIVSWGDGQFVGTVIGDTDAFKDGITVSVKFSPDTYVENLVAGCKVLVEFYKQETVQHSTKEGDNIVTEVEIVIYAVTITLGK